MKHFGRCQQPHLSQPTTCDQFSMVLSEGDKAIVEACVTEKGWGYKRIVKEFPGKGWGLGQVKRLVKRIKETGSTARKPGSGRPRTARTAENKAYVEEFIASQEEEPGTHKSQRELASDLGVGRSSVQRMTKDLGLKAYKRIRVSRRDGKVRQKRKTRCRNMHDKYSARDVKRMVFTDEKDFSYEVARNRQNDRVYGKKKSEIPQARLYHETSRFTKKVMVSAGVSWNGRTNIHFIDTNKVKVNSESYIQLLEEGLLPDCRRLYPNEDFIFQQDGAPSHTSRVTQAYLDQNTPEYIKKDEWPPQSPDCNPMDYAIWDALSEKVYSGRTEKFTEDELKAKILEKWEEISLESVRKTISSFKKRLRLVDDQDGGHIDHLLK